MIKVAIARKWFKTHAQGHPWWFSGEDSAPSAGGPGSIPGRETRYSHAATRAWHRQINKYFLKTHMPAINPPQRVREPVYLYVIFGKSLSEAY